MDIEVLYILRGPHSQGDEVTSFHCSRLGLGKAGYGLEVHYEMPHSFIGKALDALRVRRRLREDLQKSVEHLKAVLEGG